MQRVTRLVRGFVRLKSSFFLVILLIQVLLIVMSFLFARLAVAQLRQHEEDQARDVARFVSTATDQETDRALIATLGLTRNPAVVAAFAARDRPKLKALCDPIWADLQPLGVRQFNFHLPPGPAGEPVSMFLRLQNPEKFGDDVSNRPTVVRCNLQKELVKGLEQGRAGYGFRAVAPLAADGRHVGSVEFGSDFGEGFLNRLNANYAGNWGIYNLARGVSDLNDQALLVAIGSGKAEHFKPILPPEDVLQRAKAGETYFELRSATETGELYIPVRNFQNDIVLVVKHVYPTPYFRELRAVLTTAGAICLVGLLLSSFIIVLLYRQITIPIRKLVVEAENIRQFQLDGPVNIDAGLSELRELVDATRSMKIGLQSFQKYVPDQLVRQLIQTNQEARVSGVRQNLTVFFSDVADFTSISERLTPKELAGQLSEYLNELTEVVHARRGTVDKYIGDAIMAFWNAPLSVPDHPREACAAALECQRRCDALAARFEAAGRPPFVTRIGLHTGDIIVGNMGSAQRLNYTVIGDAVNLASRLEGLNKVYGTRVIISDDTYRRVADDFEVRLLDFVVVKGRTEAVTIYELVAERGEVTAGDLEFLRYFNEGVMAYKNRQWDKALRIFGRSLERRPDDKAGRIFGDRCRQFQVSPPPEDWTGEHAFDSK
jgi:class 3 adenylate cyclase